MRRHWEYLKYVVRHKWYVTIECFKEGLIWRGLVHDIDKFRPRQWMPYARHFYEKDGSKREPKSDTGYYKPYETGDICFDEAVLRHVNTHSHHWQYWCLPKDFIGLKVFPMNMKDIREMICDWKGAGRAQGVENWEDPIHWFRKNGTNMQFHDITRQEVWRMLRAGVK